MFLRKLAEAAAPAKRTHLSRFFSAPAAMSRPSSSSSSSSLKCMASPLTMPLPPTTFSSSALSRSAPFPIMKFSPPLLQNQSSLLSSFLYSKACMPAPTNSSLFSLPEKMFAIQAGEHLFLLLNVFFRVPPL